MVDDDSESDRQKNTLFAAFDDWLSKNDLYNIKADLFFIPLRIDDHYLCVCINFISKKIEILDNQFHSKAGHSYLSQLVIALVGLVCLISVLYHCYTSVIPLLFLCLICCLYSVTA